MTPPRLEACYFLPDKDGSWGRLARVLATTASRYCPDWQASIRAVTPEPRTSALGIPSHARNTEKMDEWHRIVMAANDGDRMLLIDVDTFLTGPLDPIWEQEFDLAYTTKPSRFPFNSGVVFLRISDRVRAFVDAWRAENVRMLGDKKYHQAWRAKFGGINQAALGAMLRGGALTGMQVVQIPCAVWNCEDSSWPHFDPSSTRIVHAKSGLRKSIFMAERPPAGAAPLVKLWRSIEASCLQEARTA